MPILRDLIEKVLGPSSFGFDPADGPPRPGADRPGSLWEAGSVGERPRPGAQPMRAGTQPQRSGAPPLRTGAQTPRTLRDAPARQLGGGMRPDQPRLPARYPASLPVPERERAMMPADSPTLTGGADGDGEAFDPGRFRRAAAPTVDRMPGAPLGFAEALRSPRSLRTAILLREVLDPPVALRDEPRGW